MRALRTLLWGLFLASSWTWCVGMYLPIPLLREYGWAGFAAFAIPNIIGCAAFGALLSRESSRRFVERTAGWAAAFSIVTIAYHLFFIGFVGRELLVGSDRAAPGTVLMIAAGLFFAATSLSFVPARAWPLFGAIIYVASMAAFVLLGANQGENVLAGWERAWAQHGPFGARPPNELPWLVPTLAFAFFLCPYLDLTFHRALRESPSRLSFAWFGGAFAVMLLFTAAYAPLSPGRIPLVVIGHLVLQGIFTAAAHLRELRETEPIGWLSGRPLLIAAAAWTVATLLGATPLGGEATYLRFLVAYGLVFPGLVLLIATSPKAPSRFVWIAFGMLLVLSAGLYELGFIHFETWLLPLPLLLLGGVALLARRAKSAPTIGSGMAAG